MLHPTVKFHIHLWTRSVISFMVLERDVQVRRVRYTVKTVDVRTIFLTVRLINVLVFFLCFWTDFFDYHDNHDGLTLHSFSSNNEIIRRDENVRVRCVDR